MNTFLLDGHELPFADGETVLHAAMRGGRYIPHLCWDPRLPPHSSCRLCVVLADGRPAASCTLPAARGQKIESDTPELNQARRELLQLLFTEGNHYCPSCERSGDCKLQASAYALEVQDNHFPHQFPNRARDASHPDVFLDRDRCILCGLCVRASDILDGKRVFAIGRRGLAGELLVDSPSGTLGDSRLAQEDVAVAICPVGALLPKRIGFAVPIGQRTYDREPLSVVELRRFPNR